MRHGGKILIDQLVGEGATTLFTVPGESFLAALDGLYDATSIRTIVCRQEGGAAMMAEAAASSPASRASASSRAAPAPPMPRAGLHVAHQDATPMVLFVGLIERDFREPRGLPGDRPSKPCSAHRQMGRP